MKKLLAGAVVVSLAGSAMAAGNSVGFQFGTNFFQPSAAGLVAQNGQNFTISWMLDNDVSLGVYNELTPTLNATAATVGTITVNAIQVAKGVMKNVTVGLNLGAGTVTANAPLVAATNPLADVFGSVNILSGSGDKISGNLTAVVAARFERNGTTNAGANGTNVGLAVGIVF